MSLIDGKEFDLLNADANLSGEKVNDEVSPDTSTKYDQIVKKEKCIILSTIGSKKISHSQKMQFLKAYVMKIKFLEKFDSF